MNTRILLSSAALALAVAGGAHATTTAYSTLAAFNAATNGDVTYGFNGVAPAAGYVSVGTAFTQGPVSFTGTDMFVMDAAAGFGLYGASFLTNQYGVPNTTTLSLAGATAIALHFGSYYNAGDTITFNLSDGSVFTSALPASQSIAAFIGFTSTTPITSIAVVDSSGGIVTDIIDFTLGNAGAVPEPATWALMLSGFGLAGAALRRRRQATVAKIV